MADVVRKDTLYVDIGNDVQLYVKVQTSNENSAKALVSLVKGLQSSFKGDLKVWAATDSEKSALQSTLKSRKIKVGRAPRILETYTSISLMEEVVSLNQRDADMIDTFLTTFLSLDDMSSVILLQMLRSHMFPVGPPDDAHPSEIEAHTEKTKKLQKHIVENVIVRWMNLAPLDFEGGLEVDDVLRALIEELKSNDLGWASDTLQSHRGMIQGSLEGSSVEGNLRKLSVDATKLSKMASLLGATTTGVDYPAPKVGLRDTGGSPGAGKRVVGSGSTRQARQSLDSQTLRLVDVDSEELARQICLKDYYLYRRIKPIELLKRAWGSKSGIQIVGSDNSVDKFIDQFNLISSRIAAAVVSPTSVKERAAVMTKLIDVCSQLYMLQNYNSLKAILAGFNMSPVYRLNFTKAEIDKHSLSLLRQLEAYMAPDGAHRTYRILVSKTKPPCIPFMGVTLTDLTFIGDGNDAKIDGGHNFTRCRLAFDSIQGFSRFQNERFHYQPVPFIADLLFGKQPVMGEDELYRLSLAREPRGAKKADIKRLSTPADVKVKTGNGVIEFG